jgi:hypothetical protein
MKLQVAAAASLVVASVAAGRPARASGRGGPAVQPAAAAAPAPPAELTPTPRATTKSFYGWQILASGEVGSVFVAASVFLPERPLGSAASTAGFLVGMPTYALGGPIVHWTHGDFTKGLVSFGGNAAFAVVGGFIGQARGCRDNDPSQNCAERGFFAGMAVGALIAPLVDAAVLGWEDVPVDLIAEGPPTRRARALPPSLTLAPTVGFGRRGFELGFGGRF